MKLTQLTGIIFCLAAPITLADTPDFAHLITQGQAQIHAQPDSAILQVTVSIVEDDAKVAKTASDIAVVAFTQRLIDAGISKEDINSANLDLQPRYEYHTNAPRKQVGYQANRTVTVTVKQLSQLNNILNSAIDDGLNRIDNIELTTSKMPQLQQQARQAAIKDAQTKAEDVAQGFGAKLNGVWQITYMGRQAAQPVFMRMRSQADSNSTDASYQQGKISVTDSVEVIYRIKP
ncbi:oxidative stress defense protein [Shewanella sp. NIFS-20-20]|uniref:oxidative stress defense protein n=1 Tax=Shewanella sp. NIFS-20-20 TaxID=2853806 RepID=UPI001C483ED7|nr:oxidative stress defense protein [Shewanella sp. NIFS-20-20]MBV7317469.1 oxidative stress defense protein [Shewanella sp. NIFS-20-20]